MVIIIIDYRKKILFKTLYHHIIILRSWYYVTEIIIQPQLALINPRLLAFV